MADARRTEVHRYLRGLFNVGTVAGLSDGELLDRFLARSGESAEMAFAALVERHGPMVLRVCRKVLTDSQDAADAFQATFLVLARKAGSIRRRDSLGAYLHGVALRVASCTRSAEARRRRHEQKYAERAGTSYVARPPDDLGRILHEELGRLPERFRGVAVLCDLEGKTYVEAAGLLGCPPGTVMSRLAEARRRLRGRLTRRGLAPSAGAISAALAAEAQATAKVLPAGLAQATIQAATRFLAGPATSGAVVSASVTALTDGVLKAMFLTKLKSLAMLSLVGGAVATGAGVLAQGPEPRSADDPNPLPAASASSSAAPSGDRLQSLEKKLDRVLDALESSVAKSSSTATRRVPSRLIPHPVPGVASEMMPGASEMMPGRMPGMVPGMEGSTGMLPGMMPGRLTPAVPRGRSQTLASTGSQADSAWKKGVEGRLERAEQQLNEIVDRLNRLEETVFADDAAGIFPQPAESTPKRGADVRPRAPLTTRARATSPAVAPATSLTAPLPPPPLAPQEPAQVIQPPTAPPAPPEPAQVIQPPTPPVEPLENSDSIPAPDR